jgi:hypothetical protein
MQKYNWRTMYHQKTECYGCDNITSNLSGMCDDCGGADDKTESYRPVRKAHTWSRAFDIIERQNG